MATLYEQIGGEQAVSAVIDRFYDTLLEDARVKDLFANTDMARQRRMQKSFVSGVLGGKKYTGRSMREAHKKLNLTDEHFQAVAENLEASLKYFKVSEEHISQIMAIVATTKDDVLGRDPK